MREGNYFRIIRQVYCSIILSEMSSRELSNWLQLTRWIYYMLSERTAGARIVIKMINWCCIYTTLWRHRGPSGHVHLLSRQWTAVLNIYDERHILHINSVKFPFLSLAFRVFRFVFSLFSVSCRQANARPVYRFHWQKNEVKMKLKLELWICEFFVGVAWYGRNKKNK